MGEGGEDGSARMLSLSPTLAQTGRRKLLFEGFLLFFDLNVNLRRAVFKFLNYYIRSDLSDGQFFMAIQC